MNDDRRVAVTGEVRGETESAWLFSDGEAECWVPKDRCHWDETSSEMEMPQWMAYAVGFV